MHRPQRMHSAWFAFCVMSTSIGQTFAHFPQEGYSDGMGGHRTKDFYYRCAASAEFPAENSLHLYLQVIDRYFGNAHMVFIFDGDKVRVEMRKTAEDFLNEYQGTAVGTLVK